VPSLPLFTTAYLLSLLLFHSQATLPWIWSMAFDTFGEKASFYSLGRQFSCCWVFGAESVGKPLKN
jgi:hypothetical protein